jgi:hypothetical protein
MRRRRRISWGGGTLGIAASVAILILGGNALVRWLGPETARAPGPPVPSSVTSVVSATLDDEDYMARVAELSALYEQAIPHLDPRTVEVLRESLLEIDAALERASTALAADPANPLLGALLERSRAQKLDLLHDVTRSS